MIVGLDYADGGEVIVEGHSILNMREEELTIFRRRNIGFAVQNYNLIAALGAASDSLPGKYTAGQSVV